MCVFLLYVLIVLKLCIVSAVFFFFFLFIFSLHCVIVYASFFNCVLRVRFL